MFSFPVSLMFGITGIIFDRHKLLAIISTLVAAMPVIVFLYATVLRMAFR
mgnify:CR=1 FL=1